VSAAQIDTMIKDRPPRLDQIFRTYNPPLFFLTICTIYRQKIRDLETTRRAFKTYIDRALSEFGVAVGRYVIMPDRMHLFVRGDDFKLAQWLNGLKRSISVALGASKKRPLWQPGFFDHVLRNDERYAVPRSGSTFGRTQFEQGWCSGGINGLTRANLC
jgi:REP-associated tyrosine transposase